MSKKWIAILYSTLVQKCEIEADTKEEAERIANEELSWEGKEEVILMEIEVEPKE